MNAVDVMQEIVEIPVDSGAAKSVWPIRDTRLEFVEDGRICNMKFLDADVKKPLASECAIVDEGNMVVFGPQESYIENTRTAQRIPTNRRQRICAAVGRSSGSENGENGEVRRAEHE